MYSADFSGDLILEAAKMLEKKKGICEVMPKVRLTIYEDEKVGIVTLVCQHKDPILNCKDYAEHCDVCLNKKEDYRRNKTYLREMFRALHE
jgi:hypothetical protein